MSPKKKMSRGVPSSKEATRRAKCLGPDAWHEYFQLRDGYKGQGLTPREAVERACTELKIEERYQDWRARTTTAEMLGKMVPLTSPEIREVLPGFQAAGITKAEEVGNTEMSLAEEVAWSKKQAARVQNGEEPPTKFPSEGALFWFQSAISNRREFEKVVLRVDSPVADGSNAYLQDGQHQIKDIEDQLKEAVRESGERMLELESDFGELLKEVST